MKTDKELTNKELAQELALMYQKKYNEVLDDNKLLEDLLNRSELYITELRTEVEGLKESIKILNQNNEGI